MRHTPLFDVHMQTARNVINLKEVARPLEYVGHVEEHRAIRERVSLCDVSHLGEIEIEGNDALTLVQKLLTNNAADLSVNQGLYSVMCNEDGYIIDDLVCYRLGRQRFLWVVNVPKTDKDFQWIVKHAQGLDVNVRNLSTDLALMALQGPYSTEVLQRVTKADLSTMKYYWFEQTVISTDTMEIPCIVSRTGYTGELGYEICVSRDLACLVWDQLMLTGGPLGIVPHGVAARESARIEAGYLLNGNDIDETTYPFEVGLGWVVKLSKDFIGKKALSKVLDAGVKRKLVGFELAGRHTVRYGYPIYKDGSQIGRVTSGPLSPSLVNREASFGLGFVSAKHSDIDTTIEIGIRDSKHKACVIAVPFCKRRVRHQVQVDTYSPYDLSYNRSHVWVKQDGNGVYTLGITEFCQRDLGEILYAELPKVGEKVSEGSTLAWVDTYRKVFDVMAPVSGEVVEINSSVSATPDAINKYPYARSGLVKIKADDKAEHAALLSYGEYMKIVRELRRYENWSRDKRTT